MLSVFKSIMKSSPLEISCSPESKGIFVMVSLTLYVPTPPIAPSSEPTFAMTENTDGNAIRKNTIPAVRV